MKTPVLVITLTVLTSNALAADIHDRSGWTDLAARIGLENVPTGQDVIVGQVEVGDSNGYYLADGNDPEFDGKILQRRSGGSTSPSSHATMVSRPCFGNTLGLAPGVWFINFYEVNHWLQGGYLRVGQGSANPPLGAVGGQKIWNHSWIGTFSNTTYDTDALRRNDWVVDRDGVLVSVGLNNGTEQAPLLSYGWNSISVGRRDGAHAAGTVPAPYEGAGRMKPEIVGPMYTTSEATPSINGAAAMLVEMVRDDADLPETAERPETLKSILMASTWHRGAGNEGSWTNNPIADGPDRGWTDTPLDAQYGAGHLNLDRAHEVMSGGEIDGAQDIAYAPDAPKAGWDFADVQDTMTRSWRFTFDESVGALSVNATWNRHVSATFTSWTVADFDLELLRMEGDTAVPLLGDADSFVDGNVVSASTVDNVEHLLVRGLEPGTYVVRLTLFDSGGPPSDEVAVAWWSTTDVVEEPVYGDIDGDGVVGVNDLLLMIAAWGECQGCPEDLDGNGVVDVDDILDLLIAWDS